MGATSGSTWKPGVGALPEWLVQAVSMGPRLIRHGNETCRLEGLLDLERCKFACEFQWGHI